MPIPVKWTLPLALLALFVTGCGEPSHPQVRQMDPVAPAAAGFAPVALPGQPSAIADQTPFGLYATSPTLDTITNLAIGTLSPSGQFRAALTEQGIWIARVDGAWLWQVSPEAVSPVEWTTGGRLRFTDTTNQGQEADPRTAQVTALVPPTEGGG